MKLSKASWMILAAGVFLIVLAGLGLTRSNQMKEMAALTEELSVSSLRLSNLKVTQFDAQINELQEQLRDAQERAVEARDKLKQSVISVDVADKFYEIADYYGVIVSRVGTTTISEQPFSSIDCDTISLSAEVSGELDDLVDFIKGLNDNFSTGFVRSVQINGEETVSLQMIVYSRKGN